jgi:hypothetical protein
MKKIHKATLEEREERIFKVEKLLLKGVQSSGIIARKLEISIPTVVKYKKVVYKRWKKAKNDDLGVVRDEVTAKLRFAESKAWEAFHNADNSSAKVGALKVIHENQKYQMWLTGINKVFDSN